MLANKLKQLLDSFLPLLADVGFFLNSGGSSSESKNYKK